MKSKPRANDGTELVETWPLPYAATLGSSIRAKGIFLEVRARLPEAAKRSLKFTSTELALLMSLDAEREFRVASNLVSGVLQGIDRLPVIPREIENILGISTTERHRWLKDGRLPSAGTRTVKLRGRTREVTFHVFDPHVVEDVLDRDLVAQWREDDAVTAAENKRRAAWKAKLAQPGGIDHAAPKDRTDEDAATNLVGWEEFARHGLLR